MASEHSRSGPETAAADKYLSDEMSVMLIDDFETSPHWEQYLDGKVSQSDDFEHGGKYSLKKDNSNDPHGGCRTFDVIVPAHFIFSGWLYRPSEGMRGVAEHLAVEDNRGCGYGFCVSHKIDGLVVYAIEVRENGICTENIGDVLALRNDPLKDVWYNFYFQLTESGILHFGLNVSGRGPRGILTKDSRYRKFTRVAVHGGHPYYVDDIQIISWKPKKHLKNQ